MLCAELARAARRRHRLKMPGNVDEITAVPFLLLAKEVTGSAASSKAGRPLGWRGSDHHGGSARKAMPSFDFAAFCRPLWRAVVVVAQRQHCERIICQRLLRRC